MLFFGVYSQLIMRWQVSLAGPLPAGGTDKIFFILRLLGNPWVLSGIFATFLAGVSWMLAMTKFEISYAFPWASLNFVLILLFSVLLFGESVTAPKVIGTILVMAGIGVLAKG